VGAGRLRLGTGATASIHLLPPLLRRLRTRYPELELIVVTGNAPEIAAAVAANELDVGLVTLPVTGRQLTVTPFRQDPLVAVGPPGHRWPGPGALTAAELAQQPLILYERGGTIRRVIDGWFRRGGARPRVVMELGRRSRSWWAPASASRDPEIAVGRCGRAPSGCAAVPALVRRLGLVRRRQTGDAGPARVPGRGGEPQ
jgi:DNA-binding transcriptional LysR family regulator